VLAVLFFVTGTALLFAPSKVNAAACTAPSQDLGTATTTVNIPTTGTYRIWSRMLAPDTNNNSYLLEVDGNTCYVVGDSGLTANAWTWVDYQNGNSATKVDQNLTAGTHTLKMIGREAGVKISRLLLVSDLACVPTGTGDNCAVAGDIEVPATTITAPAENANVSGSVSVNATATDNIGVTKVEFYVNGVLKSSDTTSPYSYTWNTATVPNGSTSLTVKAYDAAGNVGSDTSAVTVSNLDTQAPGVPGGVTATANAPTQITVKWNASTDNNAVAGYWVSRGGITLAQVTSGTQYVDNTVLPGTSYSYRVTAYDAAGNTSGLSSTASATTPMPPTADTQAPSTPGNMQAKAISEGQVNLGWGASTDNVAVAAYDIYRASAGRQPERIAIVTSTTYGDTNVAPATHYSYYVVARDAAGNTSSASNTANTRTLAKKGERGGIGGRIRLGRGYSPDLAYVTVSARGVKRIVGAQADGSYFVPDLPAGRYTVRYQAPRHYNKVLSIKLKTDQIKTQNVTLRKR
jgi:chitodextrinase